MEEIDRPFRPKRGFCLVWAVLTVPAALYRGEWFDETLPWYSQAAYFLFVPFAATIVLYGPALLLRQAVRSGTRGWQVLRAFLLVVSGFAGFLLLVHVFELPVNRALLPFSLAWGAVVALDQLIHCSHRRHS